MLELILKRKKNTYKPSPGDSNGNCGSAKSFKMSFKTLRMFSVPWPKQNMMTGASLRHRSLYLCVSSISPDRKKKDRQREERKGGRERKRRGPEVCLGGRWLSVAVNRQLFDAIVLAQACLSHSATAIKDSLTAETGARVETRGNPHILSFTPGIKTLWNVGLWIRTELIVLTWPWSNKHAEVKRQAG